MSKVKVVGRLPDDIYTTVLDNVPIPTVDLVVARYLPDGIKQFLLVRRAEIPYRNSYFIPGGRIFKGEGMLDAVRRQAKRELGIEAEDVRFVGCLDNWNPPKPNGAWWHSICHLYVITLPSGTDVKPNDEALRAHWFTRIAKRWPAPVREALRKVGFASR